jgi:hypothetical protein
VSEHVRQVLEMLAAGRITTEEADRLINALQEPASRATGGTTQEPARPKPRYLRVMVDTVDPKEGPIKVNVRVPFMLLRAGVRLASILPSSASQEINRALRKEGIDFDISKLKPENLDELIDELRDLTVDVGNERNDLNIKVFTE